MNELVRRFVRKYGHCWTILYFPVYMAWFMWLENTVKSGTAYTDIHVKLDDVIPFCEWFVIPYLIWFVYIIAVMSLTFFTSREEFYKASAYLFIGMSICLFICTIWPNGQSLRVEEFERDNICTRLLGIIYTADTKTNVFPSIHVFNLVGAAIIVNKSIKVGSNRLIKAGSVVLSVSIILSTVFLKQHSVVDVLGGLVLGAIMYLAVYRVEWSRVFNSKRINKNGDQKENVA